MSQPPLPVLIIGTGPSALLLAHSLLCASPSIPFRLFEKDQSLAHRAQGYRFRVTGRGVTACQHVLSPEHFALLRATCADAQAGDMKRLDAVTGDILPSSMMPKPPKAVEDASLVAERTMMRRVLFKGLEEFTTFGQRLVGYEEVAGQQSDDSASDSTDDFTKSSLPTGSIIASFADGSTVHGSLLVGADGAFSKVRAQLLSDVKLLDSSLRMAFGRTSLTPELKVAMGPTAYDMTTKGTCLIQSPSNMFFMCESMFFGGRETARATNPNIGAEIPPDYIYWALALRSEQDEAHGIDWRNLSLDETAELTEKLTADWDENLQKLLTYQDRSHTMPLFSGVMPIPLASWRRANESGPMVTLMGDAAHAMPPTAGAGATTALLDAAILGAALGKYGVVPKALAEYETEMSEYGANAIQKGLAFGKIFLPGMRDMVDMEPMERERASDRQW